MEYTTTLAEHQPIAITIGNFDGIHKGHQRLLHELRDSTRLLEIVWQSTGNELAIQTQLRREFSDRRCLVIETDTPGSPVLDGAALVKSEACRHEYTFDASAVNIASLLSLSGSAV